MAAATYSVVTVLNWVEAKIQDATNLALTEAQITAFIAQAIVADATTYTFTKRATGIYTHTSFGEEVSRLLLFQTPAAPFSGEDDKAYTVNCDGSIIVTTGTHSTSTIDVIGAPVDIGTLMPHVLMTLATRASRIEPQSMGGASIDPSQHADKLRRAAEYWRGGAV